MKDRLLTWGAARVAAFLLLSIATGFGFLRLGEAHEALCALRADLERREANTLRYLEEHPGPEPIPGISRAEILRGLENQRRTLRSLDSLSC